MLKGGNYTGTKLTPAEELLHNYGTTRGIEHGHKDHPRIQKYIDFRDQIFTAKDFSD